MIRTSAVNLVLKVGLAVTSIAFAIGSFWKSSEILDFYPQFIVSILGDTLSIALGSAIAFVMGIWLLSQRHKFAAAATYTGITVFFMLFNLNSLRFLFAIWPVFCIALSLAIRYYPRIRVIVTKKDKDGNGQIEKMKIVPAFIDEPEESSGDRI